MDIASRIKDLQCAQARQQQYLISLQGQIASNKAEQITLINVLTAHSVVSSLIDRVCPSIRPEAILAILIADSSDLFLLLFRLTAAVGIARRPSGVCRLQSCCGTDGRSAALHRCLTTRHHLGTSGADEVVFRHCCVQRPHISYHIIHVMCATWPRCALHLCRRNLSALATV